MLIFEFSLYCTVTQQYRKFLFCYCSTVVILLMWARFNAARLKKMEACVIRFFIEYGTVERLKERTEYCMPALSPTQSTKNIFFIVKHTVDF